MSKYKIVPVEPTPEMEGAHEVFGDTSDWWNAVVAVAPAPVASAEDVERVAQVIHDVEKASFIRNGGAWTGSTPEGRHYEQARAALRAMGFELTSSPPFRAGRGYVKGAAPDAAQS